MATSHHFTPPRQVQLVWRRLCEALLYYSSLAPQKYPSLLSRLCLTYVGDIKKGRFALNVKIKSVIIFADRQRRSQFEHDHRRRADQAPQTTASFT